MVIMAGMVPGVESARRRRLRHSSSSGATEAGAARRASLCLYAGGLGLGLGRDLGSSSSSAASSMVWSGEAAAAMVRAWTTSLGSDALEAKERLDHKLRGQRQPVVLKRHQTSMRPPPAKPHEDAARRGGDSDGHHRHHSAPTATPCSVLLQREVLPPSSPSRPNKKAGGCRFSWCGSLAGRRCGPPPAAEAEAECAVCLDELRAGDVVARLPCAHRFHWSCAVPWVQAVSRCPVCRAHVHVVAGPS